jgi:3-dehydroquinate dehydratase-2
MGVKPAFLMRIDLINGPNLNLLGTREPSVYGATTLTELESRLSALATEVGVGLHTFQSNTEGELVDRIQAASAAGSVGVIINPGAYTHTSIAIRDAFLGTALPFIEVHISNVYAREEFRHHSTLRDIASGCIVGLGVDGYRYALDALIRTANER